MIKTLAATLALALAGAGGPGARDFGRGIAAAAELHDICAADHARLWGANLCGPLLVVDPSTRVAWASQADADGVLTHQGQGWVGVLPPSVGVANTSLDWAGVRWIMVMGPLPEAAIERRVLVAHEAWHRIQQAIGLPALSSDCAHLESQRGRTLLRLEMRALAAALRARGAARWTAAGDALAFRAQRFRDFATARAGETALDRNEGLAAYTGVKLGAGADASAYAAGALDAYDHHPAFARAYAYATGPAYGLLLDQRAPGWRRQLGADAPADLLAGALGVPGAEAHPERYNAVQIGAEEAARAQTQLARLAELRARFSEAGRLILPLTHMRMEFDPNAVTPVEGLGSYYRTLTIHDVWGELSASDGAVISGDFQQAIVASPDGSGLAGPGWRLQLNPGYRIAATDTQGVRKVEVSPPLP